jgi:hypothetical protein
MTTCNRIEKSCLCFLSEWLGESGCGFWTSLVSNNRAGTEAMARDGVEGVPIGLGHDHATCLSGAV